MEGRWGRPPGGTDAPLTPGMLMNQLRLLDEVSQAAWIAPRLSGAFGAVTRTVPGGYPAYVRVCHPIEGVDGGWISWTEVAQKTGRQPHPLMQWHALVGSSDLYDAAASSPIWPGQDNPDVGNLPPAALAALCEVLAEHTTSPEQCFFGVWEGYGWLDGAVSREEFRSPRIQLPGRNYLPLAGPLQAAQQIGDRSGDEDGFDFDPHSPNLWWPADRAWCVATEIDFDSTLVAGSTELVDAILHSPALEAWPVGPDDSLAFDADLINPVPPAPTR